MQNSPMANLVHAPHHLDAHLYATCYTGAAFAPRAKVVRVLLNEEPGPHAGPCARLQLESGETGRGRPLPRCTGFAGLLADKTLGVGFETGATGCPG